MKYDPQGIGNIQVESELVKQWDASRGRSSIAERPTVSISDAGKGLRRYPVVNKAAGLVPSNLGSREELLKGGGTTMPATKKKKSKGVEKGDLLKAARALETISKAKTHLDPGSGDREDEDDAAYEQGEGHKVKTPKSKAGKTMKRKVRKAVRDEEDEDEDIDKAARDEEDEDEEDEDEDEEGEVDEDEDEDEEDDEDEDEDDDEEEDEEEEDEEEEEQKSHASRIVASSKEIAKAVEVSEFLTDLVMSIGEMGDDLQKSIATSRKGQRHFNKALAKTMRHMAKALQDLNERLGSIEDAPARILKSKVRVWDRQMGDGSGGGGGGGRGGAGSALLEKAANLDRLTEMVEKGQNGVTSTEVIQYEQTGILSQRIAALLQPPTA